VTADHNSTVELQRPARHALGPALVGQHAGQSAGRVHGWDQPLHFVDGPANNVSLSQSDYYFSSHSRFSSRSDAMLPRRVPPAPTQLIEMCIEPGHDLAALPAVVLAKLVERRSGPWLV
jgi:hypothetical protein